MPANLPPHFGHFSFVLTFPAMDKLLLTLSALVNEKSRASGRYPVTEFLMSVLKFCLTDENSRHSQLNSYRHLFRLLLFQRRQLLQRRLKHRKARNFRECYYFYFSLHKPLVFYILHTFFGSSFCLTIGSLGRCSAYFLLHIESVHEFPCYQAPDMK